MDRAPLYAQFDGDEVDGKRYDLGDELSGDTDAGTYNFLSSSGRFAATKPGEGGTPIDDSRSTTNMSRAELLAELAVGQSDDDLREHVQAKRDQLADTNDEGADTGGGTGGTPSPLDGNAKDAIKAVEGVNSADELADLRSREIAGENRSTVITAIDKRVEALKGA